MTYAESKDAPPFDWNAELQKKINGEEGMDAETLSRKAAEWPLCACGQQCAAIPRYYSGAPRDSVLYRSGMRFYRAVRDQEWLDAQATLAKIEHRSAEILATL